MRSRRPAAPGRMADDPRYDALPEAVRWRIGRAEYAWLSDAEKARLIETLTTPEAETCDPPPR